MEAVYSISLGDQIPSPIVNNITKRINGIYHGCSSADASIPKKRKEDIAAKRR